MTDSTGVAPVVDLKALRHLAAEAKPDPEVRALLDAADFGTLEAMVIERLEQPAANVEFLVGVIVALSRRKNTPQCELFLQLSLDAFAAHEDRAAEVAFAGALLCAWPGCVPARNRIVEVLRGRYRDCPSFDSLLVHFRVMEAVEPLEALEEVERWATFDVGRIVYGPAYGLGRVIELNLALGKVKVELQEQPGRPLSLRIGEAHKLLQALPEGHFLRIKYTDSAGLRELAARDPGELLRRLFASVQRPLPLAELRTMLAGIVPEDTWSAWWSAVRRDRRLTVGTGVRPLVEWCDSAEAADQAILSEFASADACGKIEIAQKHAARSADLAARLADGLRGSAAAVSDTAPSLALELLLAAERTAPSAAEPDALGRIMARPDVAALIGGVRDRSLRRKAVADLRKRTGSWADVYLTLLASESDSQILALIYDALHGDSAGAERLDRVVTDVLAVPERTPGFYVWLCREMLSRDELRGRADAAFCRALIGALDNSAFKGYHAALRKLFDPAGPVDAAVERMTAQEATQIMDMLDHGVNLEEHRRESLRRYIQHRHAVGCAPRPDTFLTTADSLAAKRAELQRITTIELPQNAEEIKRAKLHGDLSENAEYHAARERQEILSSRAKTLHDQLALARVLDPTAVDPSSVTAGTRVTLAPLDGAEPLVVTILGPWESDPGRHVLSHLAPAAVLLMGKRPGDEVEYDGRRYRVEKIAVWQ